MAESKVEALNEHTDPGALNAWLMFLGIQLLASIVFQGAEGARFVRAIVELHPSMIVFKWFATIVFVGVCLLSVIAGVMLFGWRRPVTVRVICAALWIGGPALQLALLTGTVVALDLPFSSLWARDAYIAPLRAIILAALWTLYLYKSEVVKARYTRQ